MARCATVLVFVLSAACSPGKLGYGGHVHVPAGSRVAYFDVRRHWTEWLTPDGPRKRSEHIGALSVDLDTFRTRFERDRRFSFLCAYDVHGRVFGSEYLESKDGVYRERLLVNGKQLHVESGAIGNLTCAVEGKRCWVFYVRAPSRGAGSHAVGRVDVATGKADHLKLPAARGIWDYLTAQDGKTVYLTGRGTGKNSGNTALTWRGDFEKKAWGKPIDGSFAVIDRKGTLLERRRMRWITPGPKGLKPTQIMIIRGGQLSVVDLGLEGPAWPLFDTGRVAILDKPSGRWVLLSLKGEPDRWLPKTPPLR